MKLISSSSLLLPLVSAAWHDIINDDVLESQNCENLPEDKVNVSDFDFSNYKVVYEQLESKVIAHVAPAYCNEKQSEINEKNALKIFNRGVENEQARVRNKEAKLVEKQAQKDADTAKKVADKLADKAEKLTQKAAEKAAEKKAAKEAKDAEKQAQKEAEKQAKKDEKDAAKQAKLDEKAAAKQAKEDEKAAKLAAKLEKEEAKAAKLAEKAVKEAEKAAKLAAKLVKEEEKAAKEAEKAAKAAAKAEKLAAKEAKKAAKEAAKAEKLAAKGRERRSPRDFEIPDMIVGDYVGADNESFKPVHGPMTIKFVCRKGEWRQWLDRSEPEVECTSDPVRSVGEILDLLSAAYAFGDGDIVLCRPEDALQPDEVNGGCKCADEFTFNTETGSCDCDAGYQKYFGRYGSPASCVEVNECETGEHDCGDYAICSNTKGSFECSCEGDMRLDETNNCYTCDAAYGFQFDDVNGGCECIAGETDIYEFQGENCECSQGFNKNIGINGSPATCSDINECETGDHSCGDQLSSLCENVVGGYTCVCPEGMRMDTSDGDCYSCPAEIGLEFADDTGCKCSADFINTQTGSCDCPAGFDKIEGSDGSAATCSDINECATGDFYCGHIANSVCVNTSGSYECNCPSNYQLDSDGNCFTCLSDNGLEFNNVGGCQCRSGFHNFFLYHNIGEKCQDIDECEVQVNDTPCSRMYGYCRNTPGSWNCQTWVGTIIRLVSREDDRYYLNNYGTVEHKMNVHSTQDLFIVRAGLANQDHFSFEAVYNPGHFLRHTDKDELKGSAIANVYNPNSSDAQDATWTFKAALDDSKYHISLRSYNRNDRYIYNDHSGQRATLFKYKGSKKSSPGERTRASWDIEITGSV